MVMQIVYDDNGTVAQGIQPWPCQRECLLRTLRFLVQGKFELP